MSMHGIVAIIVIAVYLGIFAFESVDLEKRQRKADEVLKSTKRRLGLDN